MKPEIESNYLIINQKKLHYLDTGPSGLMAVLFLHGASFSAQTWKELGTLAWLEKMGCRSVAIDLPGYGQSEAVIDNHEQWLLEVVTRLNLEQPVLVSPSMSGQYSLPFLIKHPDRVSGFIAVAPVGISTFETQLRTVSVPTLAIWGSDDHIVPVAQAEHLCQIMPNAQKIILKLAGHACYMRATHEFHEHLFKFVEYCHLAK